MDGIDRPGADGADASSTDGADASGTGHDDPFSRRIVPLLSTHPWKIVLAFFLVTALFVGGVGEGGDQEAGADGFAEEVEEFEAYEAMQDDFERSGRETGGTSAQLFVSDERNVLAEASLLRMLETQDRLENADGLRVTSTTSPASLVAQELDPDAETPDEQARAIERASDRQLEAAIAERGTELPVSTDFTAASASAEVAQVAVTYDTPPKAGTDDYADLQFETVDIVDDVDGYEAGENVIVLADAVFSQEITQMLGDTAIIVFPAAIALILGFLLVAYRDPLDLALGLTALVMTMVWTFGFMGYAGIPFSDSLVTVFPLLLAVGIDFGIHIINRYREERSEDAAIGAAMTATSEQLTTAFLIVTLTTVFGFAANLTSSLEGLRDFGIVAAAGMLFTFLIFGVFLPAGKVALDRLRAGTRFPRFGHRPLGQEGSRLAGVLEVGTTLARVAPAVVLVSALVLGAGAGAYGTGVDVEFSEEAFFPDEDRIEQYQALPGPLAPGEYNFMAALAHLEEDFEIPFIDTVTIYVDDRDVRGDGALVDVDRTVHDPPPEFERVDRRAEGDSILDVIEAEAETNPEFAAVVERHDTTGDGVPDRDVDRVYDELFDSPRSDEAETYLTSDRSATRIQLQPDVDADDAAVTAAAHDVADDMRLDATATGDHVINEAVIDRITDSSVTSLAVASVLTAIFLVLSYRWLEGRAVYGVINLVPVLLSVALLVGTMRYAGVPLSPINAPILAVSIGLGVDYTVHFTHRFVDEFEAGRDVEEALLVTVRGTGGALTGSMLTTVTGLGTLYLALIPLIMEFGLLLALGVFYAYLSSILVLPSVIVVWDRLESARS